MYCSMNVQDIFLTRAVQEKVSVVLFTTNGFQMRGTIIGFDDNVVILNEGDRQQVVYKHAISTICPSRPIDLNCPGEGIGCAPRSPFTVPGFNKKI